MSSNEEKADRLDELLCEIEDALNEMEDVVKEHSSVTGNDLIYQRADGYWLAHIRNALRNTGTFNWFDAESTITEIRDDYYEGDEDEDDC